MSDTVIVNEEHGEEEELPTFTGPIQIATETKQYVTDDEIDYFKRPFNRETMSRVSKGNFEKILASADGRVKSKQGVEGQQFSVYGVTDTVEPVYNFNNLAGLYEADPYHAAAVDALVDNVVGLGYYFDYTRKAQKQRAKAAKEGPDAKEKLDEIFEDKKDQFHKKINSYNQTDSLDVVLEKFVKDRYCMGNGYLEIGRNVDGSIGYIGHIPAQTIRMRRLRDGFVQYVGDKPVFFKNFGDKSNKNPLDSRVPNEILHYGKASPLDPYYGVPEVVSATDAIAGNQFATRYNLEYFENKAVPRYIIKIKGMRINLDQRTELVKFFESTTRGQSHRTMLLPMPGGDRSDIEFEAIEAGKQEASFLDFANFNIKTILARHRVPANRLGMSDGGSLAGSRDADKIFKESVCRPEQRKLESLLGKVFGELTNMFDFKLSEYTLTDEDQQSIIDDRDIKNGSLLPDERRVKIGLPARPDGNGDQAIDIRSLQLLQQEMQQKLQDTQLKSQEKIAASNAKAQAAAKAAAPATGTKAPVKAVAKPAGAAQKKAEQKVAGNRAVNSQRSATRSNAPGAPATRNPKGSGRQSK